MMPRPRGAHGEKRAVFHGSVPIGLVAAERGQCIHGHGATIKPVRADSEIHPSNTARPFARARVPPTRRRGT